MKIKIQKFKKEQAKKVSKLVTDCFNEYVAPSFSPKARKEWLARMTPQRFIEDSKLKERDIYVATKNDQIVGVIVGMKNSRIALLFVKKNFHKKGVGEKLVNKIELIFKKKGAKTIKVHSSIYAVKFYEKMGYKKLRGFLKRKGMVYQPMRKIL